MAWGSLDYRSGTFVAIEGIEPVMTFTEVVNAHYTTKCYDSYVNVSRELLDGLDESGFQPFYFVLGDAGIDEKKESIVSLCFRRILLPQSYPRPS